MKQEPKRGMVQSSEAVRVGMLLALSGGFLDAYTYLVRGHVFANTQTGNIVMLGLVLAERNWAKAVGYLLPILAFVLGVILAELLRTWGKANPNHWFHWRQTILSLELLLLIPVGFMPATDGWNMVANICVSFVCSLQVESFRRMHGKIFATTMCTGNLRSGTELMFQYVRTKDKTLRQHAMHYYGVILSFIAGAAVSTLVCNVIGIYAVWISCAIFLVLVLILFHAELETKRPL